LARSLEGKQAKPTTIRLKAEKACILGPIWSVWRGAVTTISYEPTRHSAQSQTMELANFDDDQGHIVGERAMPPGSHAVEDRLPHFRQWKLCGIED
jgi:hypothetical protein